MSITGFISASERDEYKKNRACLSFKITNILHYISYILKKNIILYGNSDITWLTIFNFWPKGQSSRNHVQTNRMGLLLSSKIKELYNILRLFSAIHSEKILFCMTILIWIDWQIFHFLVKKIQTIIITGDNINNVFKNKFFNNILITRICYRGTFFKSHLYHRWLMSLSSVCT